eukprot:3354777-Amphidinium_carterae.1
MALSVEVTQSSTSHSSSLEHGLILGQSKSKSLNRSCCWRCYEQECGYQMCKWMGVVRSAAVSIAAREDVSEMVTTSQTISTKGQTTHTKKNRCAIYR